MTAAEIQEVILSAGSVGLAYIGKFLNSAFALSFVGALAGAAAGALAAQRVIERSRARDDLLKEIRNTNAAMMVSFTICNTALGLKKQLVGPMHERFLEARKKFLAFREHRQAGQSQGNAPFHFEADLQGFMAPILPIETLKLLVFDRISAYGKALNLVSLVENAGIGLANAIDQRDRLIAEFKGSALPPDAFALRYFGEKLASGHTHREYADLVDVIHSYTNDLIYFSGKLCAELATHGQAKGALFSEQFGKDAPTVSAPDFSGPKESGLFPPDSDYSSWLNWIVEKRQNAKGGAK
ncbi:MAG: hypothetical protein HYY78_07985 [Betaproteobacteria bacterium]|nr:hypothetical protein [Betaproteobacteria bacterium]